MRAAPPVQLTLTRFGAWHAALAAVAGLGLTALCAWAALRSTPFGPLAWAAVAMGGAACLAAAFTARAQPAHLAWDGQSWRAGPAAAAIDSLAAGQITVCVDLGPWLLLRFDPLDLAQGRRRWLPVQPDGLAAGQWHALRCAVYAPSQPPVSAGGDLPGA